VVDGKVRNRRRDSGDAAVSRADRVVSPRCPSASCRRVDASRVQEGANALLSTTEAVELLGDDGDRSKSFVPVVDRLR